MQPDPVLAAGSLAKAAAPTPDVFALGRTATQIRQTLSANRCVFSRSRRLLNTGIWQGPKDAADAFVEEADLVALGGLEAAMAAGARLFVASTLSGAQHANAAGLRCALRVPFRATETHWERQERLHPVHTAAQQGNWLEAIVPTPVGEPLGLDTLSFFATCRVTVASVALVADFTALGHRLAQMALGFGANEVFGPIVSERALRIGDNANNPAMTRKEVAVFIRGAGLIPFERLAGGRLEEVEA